jgi:hypothetical protein
MMIDDAKIIAVSKSRKKNINLDTGHCIRVCQQHCPGNNNALQE